MPTKVPPQREDRVTGRVRIIAGHWRRSVLHFPARPDLRPTPDRVRETLFNWLGQELSGLSCLDLFSGSGALGFEAASRGASRVVLVEKDRAAAQALQENAQRLHATTLEIVCADASDWMVRANERFDVVFLDPPFRQNALAQVLEHLPRLLVPGARVHAEAAEPVDPGCLQAGWRELKRARAGQVSHQLLEWNDDRSGLPGNV